MSFYREKVQYEWVGGKSLHLIRKPGQLITLLYIPVEWATVLTSCYVTIDDVISDFFTVCPGKWRSSN